MLRIKPLTALITLVALFSTPTLVAAADSLTITNGDTVVELQSEDVVALQQTSFETSTIWTEGTINFSGPSLKSVLELADITDGVVTLTALNDYAIKIAVEDITENAPIVAYLMNDEPFSRREKGPYWVVFPYDSDTKYQQEEIYAVSIWQLVSVKKDIKESKHQ